MSKSKSKFKKIAIGALVLLLVLAGLSVINTLLELGEISKSIVIDASAEEVFEFTGDWRFFWQPTTEKTEGEGARFSYTTKELGIDFDIETEIIRVSLNEKRVWKTVSGADIEAQWFFEPLNGSTKTTYIIDYDLPIPIIANIIDVLLVRERREIWVEDMLQNLKTLIEE